MAVNLSTGYVQLRNAGHSFVDLFDGGCMEVRTGPQPETADMPVTGSLVARITRGGRVWTPGSASAGLRFTSAGRYMAKQMTDAWQLVGEAAGTAGWVRLVGNVADPGTGSLTHARIDGAVDVIGATTDSQLFLPTVEITAATIIDINYWWFAPPPLPGD